MKLNDILNPAADHLKTQMRLAFEAGFLKANYNTRTGAAGKVVFGALHTHAGIARSFR